MPAPLRIRPGEKHWRLTIIEQVSVNPCRVRCICECGNEHTTDHKALVKGSCKSCGCLSAESVRKPKLEVKPGTRFGSLIVIKREFVPKKKRTMMLCRCDCGQRCYANLGHLRAGSATKCPVCRARAHQHSLDLAAEKRGIPTDTFKSHMPEYVTYLGMRARCENPKHRSYPNYGDRGVKVCDRWRGPRGFENFMADVGRRPSSDYSLDRIDMDGDYEPRNVRWATVKEQNRNRRANRFIEYNGERLCITDWAKRIGITSYTLSCRLKNGWSIEKALTTPSNLN